MVHVEECGCVEVVWRSVGVWSGHGVGGGVWMCGVGVEECGCVE